jgi:AcrR family transcriptional regulator
MAATRGRPQDPEVTRAVLAAAARLFVERGFAGTSMDAVAGEAGVGKPAIYRRFADKVELVTAVIQHALPPMRRPTAGDPYEELWQLAVEGFPADGEAYVGLIGELMAERDRRPELIAAFREQVLLPRRAIVRETIADLQRRGALRDDLPAEELLDLLAGPFLARAFAGADVGPAWRRRHYDWWYGLMRADR